MSAIQPLCHLIGINSKKFSKKEYRLLEAEIFTRICEELKEIIRNQNKDYFCLMKLDLKKENIMVENILIKSIINDILSTEEYNLSGIAYYTDTPEEIIFEIASGRNKNPTLFLSTKIIIELHRSVRPNLYQEIIKKILKKQSAEAA